MYQDDEDDDHGPALRDDDRGVRGRVETHARVTCPHCAEEFELSLDPGGGGEQEYVEDCEVCCRACRVHVTWDEDGAAEVEIDEV